MSMLSIGVALVTKCVGSNSKRRKGKAVLAVNIAAKYVLPALQLEMQQYTKILLYCNIFCRNTIQYG